jgi:hypothetical protein
MCSKKSDHQHACLILQGRNQSVVVAFDIENHPAALGSPLAATPSHPPDYATELGQRWQAIHRIANVPL